MCNNSSPQYSFPVTSNSHNGSLDKVTSPFLFIKLASAFSIQDIVTIATLITCSKCSLVSSYVECFPCFLHKILVIWESHGQFWNLQVNRTQNTLYMLDLMMFWWRHWMSKIIHILGSSSKFLKLIKVLSWYLRILLMCRIHYSSWHSNMTKIWKQGKHLGEN